MSSQVAAMRFLTKAWHSGDLSDEDCNAAEVAFLAGRDRILPQLPSRVQEFVRNVNIHDALVRSICLDHRRASFRLNVRAGDRQRGYIDLDLVCSEVDPLALDIGVVRRIAANPSAEALYDEFDVVSPSHRYEHRWLRWPHEDLTIQYWGDGFHRCAATPARVRPRVTGACRDRCACRLTIVEPDERAMDGSLRSLLFDSFAG
jgi:hypothetical protein